MSIGRTRRSSLRDALTLAALMIAAAETAACQEIEDQWAARRTGEAPAEPEQETKSMEPAKPMESRGAEPRVSRGGDTITVRGRDGGNVARVTQSGGADARVDVESRDGVTVIRSRSRGGSVTIIQGN